MAFDANLYQALAAQNPAAAAAYLAQETGQNAAAQAPANPVPPTTFTPPVTPPANQAQGLPQYQNTTQAQPTPELARGTVEDFFNQRTATLGGPSLKKYFKNKPTTGPGIHVRVLKDITHTDVRQQTEFGTGIPVTDKRTGKPKFDLWIPVEIIESTDGLHAAEFPDNISTFYVTPGVLKDELQRSMVAAGKSGYPSKGDELWVVAAGEKPNRQYQATKLYNFTYIVNSAPVAEAAPAPVAEAPAVVPPTTAATQPAPVTPAAPTASAPVADVPTANGNGSVEASEREKLLAELLGQQK